MCDIELAHGETLTLRNLVRMSWLQTFQHVILNFKTDSGNYSSFFYNSTDRCVSYLSTQVAFQHLGKYVSILQLPVQPLEVSSLLSLSKALDSSSITSLSYAIGICNIHDCDTSIPNPFLYCLF